MGLNCVQCFCVFPLQFWETTCFLWNVERQRDYTTHNPQLLLWRRLSALRQTPWLIFKLWDWMLEWQCAKVTPSVKLFEMERNHGRLFKTGLERPPGNTHAVRNLDSIAWRTQMHDPETKRFWRKNSLYLQINKITLLEEWTNVKRSRGG